MSYTGQELAQAVAKSIQVLAAAKPAAEGAMEGRAHELSLSIC